MSSSLFSPIQSSSACCKQCSERTAKFYCLPCKELMCFLCQHFHSMSPAFKTHQIISLNQQTNDTKLGEAICNALSTTTNSRLEDISGNHTSTKLIFCDCLNQNVAYICCKTCNKFLCFFCQNAHSRIPFYQNHKFTHLYTQPNLTEIKEFETLSLTSEIEDNSTNLLVDGISKILKNCEDNLPNCSNNLQPVTCSPRPILAARSNGLVNSSPVPDPQPSVVTFDHAPNVNYVNSMQIYKSFGQKGISSGQFHSPHGFCLGFNEDIVVADTVNHRIQVFDNVGNFKFQFGITGKTDGHLWYPRKVAVLPIQKKYVVCDHGHGRSRMQLFTNDGKFFGKISIQYINILAGVAVTKNEEIVAVDSVTPTIFILGTNDFLRSIDCTNVIQEPSDIQAIDEELYICDFKGHTIVVMDMEGNFLRQFGSTSTINFPNGIDITSDGDIVVGDSHGNFFHVTIFSKTGDLISEYRCPYLKVSRCCGLKVNSEGHLITVDKNFHHVIMLNVPHLKMSFK